MPTKAPRAKINKRRLQHVKAAFEVTRSELRLIVVDHEQEQPAVRVHAVTWRHESGPLHSEEGIRELTTGFKTLIARERLPGATVSMALSGDFCVTRVVAGENDEVRSELRSLEERTSHYLSLGTGENKLATCSKPLDAKHQQTWVTVANRRTLNAILKATEHAGIHVHTLEHSLVSLARAVGVLERDRELPVLLLEMGERGIDIGISYQGQLLIDYRPGGIETKAQISHIVLRHFERLQRFCNRRFRFASGDISRIFICGDPEDVALVREQFAGQDRLQAEVLVPHEVLTRCELPAAESLNPTFTPCIGLLANQRDGHAPLAAPNLMGDLVSRVKEPLWPTLGRVGWPVAVALLLTAGVFLGGLYQKLQCARLSHQLHSYDEARTRIAGLRSSLTLAQHRATNLRQISTRLRPTVWNDLITAVGISLPQGVWLERLSVESEGLTRLAGPSHSEDGIFEFVKALKQQAILQDVALEGTQPIQFNGAPATRFDITCKLVEPVTPPDSPN